MSLFNFSTAPALAYDVSRWASFLFDQRAAISPKIQAATRNIASAVFDVRRADATTPAEREAAFSETQREATRFGQETFARLYNGPAAVEGAEGWAVAAHKVLSELPEWDALRESVAGDPDMAAIAAQDVLPAVADKLPGLLGALEGKRNKPSYGSVSEDLGKEGQQLRAALRRVLAHATEQVADAREALAGLCPGSESAPPTHAQRDTTRLTLAESLLRRRDFRDVLRMAGKLQRLACRRAEVKDPHARGEVVGLERGADLARVLPSEFALLGDDGLDVLFFKAFGEGALTQYKLEGKEPMGKGPVVILLDESASMEGHNEQWAKAAALACLATGQKEGRDVIVAFFQYEVTAAWISRKGGKVEAMDCRNPNAATTPWGDTQRLAMELLTRRTNGGTSFTQPLEWALSAIESGHPKADIVFVTDGDANATPAIVARFTTARAAGLRVYGLVVSGGAISPAVQAVCTATLDLDRTADVDGALAEMIPTRPD